MPDWETITKIVNTSALAAGCVFAAAALVTIVRWLKPHAESFFKKHGELIDALITDRATSDARLDAIHETQQSNHEELVAIIKESRCKAAQQMPAPTGGGWGGPAPTGSVG